MQNARWFLGLSIAGLVVGCSSSPAGPSPAGCGAGQASCDGACASIASDPNHCGGCGVVCGAGQTCNEGVCICIGSTTACGGQCLDLTTNGQNCGACGAACAAGQQCAGGECQCQAGLTACDGACANLQGDGANCGSCGVVCPAGQVCASGACSSSCPAATVQCGSSCVSPASDPLHCGACGAACPAPMACANGVCGCPAGSTDCGGQCTDTSADPSNCGACGVACAGGKACVAGACACAAGQSFCVDRCTDLLSDASNCGACGTGCGSGACVAGQCLSGSGGAGTGGVASGGVATGGAPPSGGTAMGGASTGGVQPTGGASTGGASTGGGTCTNIRPTGTQWDEATCDQWATQTSECQSAWMVDSNYCNESCGRCSSATGGAGGTSGTGGAATGGAGTGGAGGGVTFDCGNIPVAGTGNVPRPSGAAGNLRVLNWAGFKAAVTFSFDDNTTSTIAAYDQLAATGVRMTYYLWTGRSSFTDPVWGRARDAGSELGNHTSDHLQSSVSVDGMNTGKADIERQWGVIPYTFAAPYGNDYSTAVAGKYLLSRDAGGVTPILPNGNDNLGKLAACLPQNSAEVTTRINQARSAGGWMFFCIHGFSASDGSYLPLDLNGFISAVNSAKQLGDTWLDTAENIGAYYAGQRLVSRATQSGQTWSWTLPGGFPPNKCLRVTVDGGTVKQGGQAVAWDPHGYYEISLDAGSVTVAP